ncbi:GCN5 family acetyltransferase [Novosphingobium fuchskuhlense]|uniref:GCN5 family acetyltransferase n=1 Tax=Novosphingobium fuchskuhlense TaxID=1117702 RepID=A0A124JUJ4_9SPHN|nr:GNAT family N-acetyltransferase [Novosphingobium fuchskuhlense]KUR71299.1 GCN5 family acetyltransferase [Novosphingobium fuchskuhlense]
MTPAHPLDRPIWSMLNGPQASLAIADGPVCRIDPTYGPFAAAAPGHEAELAGLLAGAEDEIWLVEAEEQAPPSGTRVLRTAPLLQMIADGPPETFAIDPDLIPMSEADAADMARLALETQPGPWRSHTHRYGSYYGLREDGRLIAMAGERMRPALGLAELSGVCTAPDRQGRGLAGRMIRRVLAGFAARADTPFLHSYAYNAHAIRLYETLGFRARLSLVVTVLGKAE